MNLIPKVTCGVISKAVTKDSPDLAYENLGKLVISNMNPPVETEVQKSIQDIT